MLMPLQRPQKGHAMTEEEALAELWEIARRIAKDDPVYYDNRDRYYYCIYCRGFETPDQWLVKNPTFKHEPHCIALKARTLVAQNAQQSHCEAQEIHCGARDGQKR